MALPQTKFVVRVNCKCECRSYVENTFSKKTECAILQSDKARRIFATMWQSGDNCTDTLSQRLYLASAACKGRISYYDNAPGLKESTVQKVERWK